MTIDVDANKLISHPLFAGIAGALIGLRFAPGVSWFERVLNVATGGAFAGFVAPAAAEMFKLSSSSMMSFLSFFVGMFGMSIAAAVFQWLRDGKLGEIITSWFVRRG